MKSVLFSYLSELTRGTIKTISNGIILNYLSNKSNTRNKILQNITSLIEFKYKKIMKIFFDKLKQYTNDNLIDTSKEISNDFLELVNVDKQHEHAHRKNRNNLIAVKKSYSVTISLSDNNNSCNENLDKVKKMKHNIKKKKNFSENCKKCKNHLKSIDNKQRKETNSINARKVKIKKGIKSYIFTERKNTKNKLKYLNTKMKTISEYKNSKINEETMNIKIRKIGLIPKAKQPHEIKNKINRLLKKTKSSIFDTSNINYKKYLQNCSKNLMPSFLGNNSTKKLKYEHKSTNTANDMSSLVSNKCKTKKYNKINISKKGPNAK